MTDQNMPQPSAELRRINWGACFPFMTLFRTFRLAMQPSKLALALAAVLLTGVWGDVLDGLWRSKCQPPASEVNAFWQQANINAWRESVKASWPQLIRDACEPIKVKLPEKLDDRLAANPDDAFDLVLDRIRTAHNSAIEGVRTQFKASKGEMDAEIARRARDFVNAYQKVQAVAPRGVYASFLEFERGVGRQMVSAAVHLNFVNGVSDALTSRISPPPPPTTTTPVAVPAPARLGAEGSARMRPGANGLAEDLARRIAAASTAAAATEGPRLNGLRQVGGGPNGPGVLACAALALRGVQWMTLEHFWFAVLFWLPVLAIWGLFGGAICRMAALNVARDERPSAGTSLRFAQRKLPSLATAPLFPIGFVVLIGVVLFVGGVFMAIPGLGEIVGGLGIVLGLAAGLLMAAVLIGGLAGAPLMWPTIAVEGSDAFDAFARGYGYVFNRPWRAAFYAAVLTVYGAICYLFVRFFMLVGLKAARFFIGAGLGGTSRPGAGSTGATKIDVLWPTPTWDQLLPDRLPLGTQAWDAGGAWLIGLWLTLVMALLCAFAASFFLSGSTIIYYLLRREVDATDLEVIYLESDEEEDQPLDLPGAAGEPGAASAPPDVSAAQGTPPGPAQAGPATDEPPSPGDGNIDAE